MLVLALQLQEAIDRFGTLEKTYSLQPSEEDWNRVKALIGHLKVFYDATMKLSGTKYPTLNLYFPEFCEVYLSIEKMKGSAYEFVVEMGKEMLLKWDKYWQGGNALLAIGCVLDPRCKLHVVEYYYKMINPQDCARFMTSIQGCLLALFNEYSTKHSNHTQSSTSSTQR